MLTLNKEQVLHFVRQHNFMTVATYGDFPWIASVYYSFDKNLNLYFLSDPATLHCRQIKKNPRIAVAIADSRQPVNKLKKGLQLWGLASQISGERKIVHALSLWKKTLRVRDPELTYANMLKKVVTGRMYRIVPKRIKLFDQELFKVDDGKEPVLEL